MPDAIFDEPRLAAVYDPLDPDRSDLDEYEAIVVDELGASSLLDIGCGTGTFAVRLAARGLTVTGLDPARASVDVARGKDGTDAVTWIVGTVDSLPPIQVDAVTMTANVSQVFLSDGELVTFISPTIFHADGTRIDSISTLRFRTRSAIEAAIERAALRIRDVRDLGYAPGRAWLYLATRP